MKRSLLTQILLKMLVLTFILSLIVMMIPRSVVMDLPSSTEASLITPMGGMDNTLGTMLSVLKPLVGVLFMAFLLSSSWDRFRGVHVQHASPAPLQISAPIITGVPLTPLEHLPEVMQLRNALRASLTDAREAGDARWEYDAQASLDDYLPETLFLHFKRQGEVMDEELRSALGDIRVIGTRQQQRADQTRWQVQKRFLEDRAERHPIENELRL
jgi:hypothetical protein